MIGSFHVLLHKKVGSPYFRVLMSKCNISIFIKILKPK
jgi:hypothetical protein